ncbi:MAG TPA: hypothetical protein VF032_01065 [Thermoleophilaceae bacterium]
MAALIFLLFMLVLFFALASALGRAARRRRMLKALCQEAALAAMLRGADARITQEDFDTGLERVKPPARELAPL